MIAEKECRHCGAVKLAALFPRNARLADGLDSWCKKCHAAAVSRSPSVRARLVGTRPCVRCGSKVQAPRKYCGKACQPVQARLPVVRKQIACPTCQKQFVALRSDSTYCSRQCQPNHERYVEKKRLRLRARRMRVLLNRVCLFCGKKAVDRDGSVIWNPRASKFCTVLCSREFHSWRRRDSMRGSIVEPVDINRLIERDGGVCQLCRKPVQKNHKKFAPNSPTIDHVIPISAGGEHSYRNTQLAHRRCNNRKSAGPAQLNWINQVAA